MKPAAVWLRSTNSAAFTAIGKNCSKIHIFLQSQFVSVVSRLVRH